MILKWVIAEMINLELIILYGICPETMPNCDFSEKFLSQPYYFIFAYVIIVKWSK